MDEPIPFDKNETESEAVTEASPTRSWIENRGLLRDEGTVLGLGGMEEGLEHKIEVIRSHFEEKKAEVHRKREQLDQKLSQVERRRSKAEEKISRLQERIEDPPVPERAQSGDDRRYSLFRYAIGLLCAAGICGFNFFLLHELLRGHFEHPLLVTAGIFCTGLFALFQPTSLFFRAGQKKQDMGHWTRWLTEVGMPVAASLFAVSWSYKALGPLRAGSLFLYLAMTFLLGGKLLLRRAIRPDRTWPRTTVSDQTGHPVFSTADPISLQLTPDAWAPIRLVRCFECLSDLIQQLSIFRLTLAFSVPCLRRQS